MKPRAAPRWRLPISAHLIGFGIAVLIPVLIAATVTAWGLARQERQRLEQQAATFARDVTHDIDRELQAATAALQALAASPSLQRDDFSEFDRQAREVVAMRGFAIALRDASGQQFVNTFAPPGAKLPVSTDATLRATDAEVFRTGKPVVSNLYRGAVTKTLLVLVNVPVKVGGEVRYALNMAIAPDRIRGLIAEAGAPPDWTIGVVDENFRIIARSREHDRYFGQEASQSLKANARTGATRWYGVTLEGTPVLTTATRIQSGPWLISVSIPRSDLEEPLRRLLQWITGTALVGLVGSVGLATIFGRGLAAPVHQLAGAAEALGRGEVRPGPVSSIREVQDISAALGRAARDLAASTQERDEALRSLSRSEGRLRATYENAAVGIAEVDSQGRLLLVNETLCRISGYSRDELLGRNFAELSAKPQAVEDWANFERQRRGEQPSYVIEKEFTRRDGVTRWLKVFSTAVQENGRFGYAVRVVLDVTDAHRAARHQNLLIAELNHRVKNMLAVVQSLVTQTLRTSASPEAFRQALTGRIMALARSHELLSENEWRGTSLDALARLTFAAYQEEGRTRFTASGPLVQLGPRAVVSVSLLLHELSTNAARHGALSMPEGTVELSWTVEGDPEAAQLVLHWREHARVDVDSAKKPGFGSLLIRLSIEQELGGIIETRLEPDGFRLTARVPLAMCAV